MGHPLHAKILLFLGTKKTANNFFKKNLPELISQWKVQKESGFGLAITTNTADFTKLFETWF